MKHHSTDTEPGGLRRSEVSFGALARLSIVAMALTALAATAAPANAAGRASIGTGQASCDPAYGCPPGTPPPPPAPACSLSVASAAPGVAVTASVTNAGAGASVRITFDGVEVAAATTGSEGSANIQWQVPPRTPPGQHQVFAVGATFNVQCGPFEVPGGTQVLGESTARNQGTAVAGSQGGSLARTGIEIAALLAAAVVLILAGSQLLRLARRHRRRLARRRNEVRDLSKL